MAQQFQIEVETFDFRVAFEMFESRTGLSSKTSRIILADGSTVAYAGTYERRGLNFPSIVHAGVDLAGTVGVGLFTNWLYDKLKGKPAKLRINRQEVEITPERIRIVIEQIEREG